MQQIIMHTIGSNNKTVINNNNIYLNPVSSKNTFILQFISWIFPFKILTNKFIKNLVNVLSGSVKIHWEIIISLVLAFITHLNNPSISVH
jgi:hypothetical protein